MSAKESGLAIITPSYDQDYEQFIELRRSLADTMPRYEHYVVVPTTDVSRFSKLNDVTVLDENDLLTDRMISVGRHNIKVSRSRPWWPVRGWIRQQILKLELAGRLDCAQVALVDSDIYFVRPLPAIHPPPLVRRSGMVNASMKRHVKWHAVARGLLGIEGRVELPTDDYVSPVTLWEPGHVRRVLTRVEEVSGERWIDVVAARRHFSEFTLYGTWIDNFLANRPPSVQSWCLEHWAEEPLDMISSQDFCKNFSQNHVGVMVSAKSHTPRDVREAIYSRLQAATDEP